MKTIPKPNTLVVLSDHPAAFIYIVKSTWSRNGIVYADLIYRRLDGNMAQAGAAEVSCLMYPTTEQLGIHMAGAT